MPAPSFLTRIQELIGVAVSEFDEVAVLQDGGLVDPLAVHVGVGIGVAGRQGCQPIGVGDHAVSRLDVRSVELQRYPVR